MKIKDIRKRIELWYKDQMLPAEEEIRLINEVDKKLWDNIISNHECDIEYTVHESVEDEVLVPEEYGDIYVHYILSQVHLRLYQTERASHHMALFNELYSSYGNYITREYMPKQRSKITL